jgi:hypothetical protein
MVGSKYRKLNAKAEDPYLPLDFKPCRSNGEPQSTALTAVSGHCPDQIDVLF